MRQDVRTSFVLFFSTIVFCKTLVGAAEKPFVFIIPSYNNELYYQRNLDSVFAQDYGNYRVIYIDDCSPDGTGDLVEAYVKKCGQQHRFTLIKNKVRCLQLANRYKAIHMCDDKEIMVMLDGDDFLVRTDTLKVLNELYRHRDAWYILTDYMGWCNACDDATIDQKMHPIQGCSHKPGASWREPVVSQRRHCKTIRKYRFNTRLYAVHLRTFYAGLFKRIALKDLMHKGTFFFRSTEIATTMPLLEMSIGHAFFLPEVHMFLNRQNVNNCRKVYNSDPFHRQFGAGRISLGQEIYQRMPYSPVEIPCIDGVLPTVCHLKFVEKSQCSNVAQKNFSKGGIIVESTSDQCIKNICKLISSDYVLISTAQIEGQAVDQAIKVLQQTQADYALIQEQTHLSDLTNPLLSVTLPNGWHAIVTQYLDSDYLYTVNSDEILIKKSVLQSIVQDENVRVKNFLDVLSQWVKHNKSVGLVRVKK